MDNKDEINAEASQREISGVENFTTLLPHQGSAESNRYLMSLKNIKKSHSKQPSRSSRDIVRSRGASSYRHASPPLTAIGGKQPAPSAHIFKREIPQNINLYSVRKKTRRKESKKRDSMDYKTIVNSLNQFFADHPKGIDNLIDGVVKLYLDETEPIEFVQTKFLTDLEELNRKKKKKARLERELAHLKELHRQEKGIVVEIIDKSILKRTSKNTGLIPVSTADEDQSNFTTVNQVKSGKKEKKNYSL